MKSRKQRKQATAETLHYEGHLRNVTNTQSLVESAYDTLHAKYRTYWGNYRDEDLPKMRGVNMAWHLVLQSQTALDRKNYTEVNRLCKTIAGKIQALAL